MMMMMLGRGTIALQVSLGGRLSSSASLAAAPGTRHALRLCRHSSPVRIVVVSTFFVVLVVSRVLVVVVNRMVMVFLGTLLVVLERVDHDQDDRACVITCLSRHS